MYVAFRTPAEIALQKEVVVISRRGPDTLDRLETNLGRVFVDVARVLKVVQ